MTDACETEYTLSGLELSALLLGLGVQKLYGFALLPSAHIAKADAAACLQRLSARSLIHISGDGCALDPELKRYIDGVVNARYVILIRTEDALQPPLCVYADEVGYTCVEANRFIADRYHICRYDTAHALLEHLEQLAYLPTETEKEAGFSLENGRPIAELEFVAVQEDMVYETVWVDDVTEGYCIRTGEEREMFSRSKLEEKMQHSWRLEK